MISRRRLFPIVGALAHAAPANRIEIHAPDGFSPARITCWAGDQISWRNRTRETHEIGVINEDGKFVGIFDRPLAPGDVSAVFTPSLRLDAKNKQETYTLEYVCKHHPHERGVIVVNPVP